LDYRPIFNDYVSQKNNAQKINVQLLELQNVAAMRIIDNFFWELQKISGDAIKR